MRPARFGRWGAHPFSASEGSVGSGGGLQLRVPPGPLSVQGVGGQAAQHGTLTLDAMPLLSPFSCRAPGPWPRLPARCAQGSSGAGPSSAHSVILAIRLPLPLMGPCLPLPRGRGKPLSRLRWDGALWLSPAHPSRPRPCKAATQARCPAVPGCAQPSCTGPGPWALAPSLRSAAGGCPGPLAAVGDAQAVGPGPGSLRLRDLGQAALTNLQGGCGFALETGPLAALRPSRHLARESGARSQGARELRPRKWLILILVLVLIR